jgi:hypothetical protein
MKLTKIAHDTTQIISMVHVWRFFLKTESFNLKSEKCGDRESKLPEKTLYCEHMCYSGSLYLFKMSLYTMLRQAQDERNMRNALKKAAHAEPCRSMSGFFA